MTLQELRYLVALADAGHFGQAAEACHISQSTLSTQVKKLEDYLGVTLFDRSLRRVVPTPVGQQILASARQIVEEAARIKALASHAKDPMSRTLQLGVIPTLGPYFLPHALSVVHRIYPSLRLLLREDITERLLELLAAGRIDAALIALPVADESLESFALFDEPFWVALPADHKLAAKNKLRVKDMEQCRLLLLEDGHCLRDQALEVCGPQTRADEEVRATSLETLRQMVGMGIGVTLLPALAVDAAPKQTRRQVAVRPFAAPQPHRRIGLVWRKRFPWSETLERLGETLRHNLPKEVQAAA